MLLLTFHSYTHKVLAVSLWGLTCFNTQAGMNTPFQTTDTCTINAMNIIQSTSSHCPASHKVSGSSLVPRPCPAFRRLQSHLQATESWEGPGNEAGQEEHWSILCHEQMLYTCIHTYTHTHTHTEDTTLYVLMHLHGPSHMTLRGNLTPLMVLLLLYTIESGYEVHLANSHILFARHMLPSLYAHHL